MSSRQDQREADRKWIVKGLIAARHLPAGAMTIVGVSLRPLEQAPKWTANFQFGMNAEVEEGMKGTPIVALPPPIGFQAYHGLQLRSQLQMQATRLSLASIGSKRS